MPRSSPNLVLLSAVEREQLEATARKYTAPYLEVVRAKLILLAAEGLQNKEIGQRLDLPRQVVSKMRLTSPFLETTLRRTWPTIWWGILVPRRYSRR